MGPRGLQLAILVALCCTAFGQDTSLDAADKQAVQNATMEEPSCDDLTKVNPSTDLCSFAEEYCEEGSLIPYIRLYYCGVSRGGRFVQFLFLVTCVLGLLLLFRVLGSTAEDFFSPILTQLSQELGLPPRFAGVTFLALGNGAPDLSSSIAAVKAGQYELALGAQVGGGMFVGCVVSGCVILVSGGAKARGALKRDVGIYMVAVALLAAFLMTGKMTYVRVSLLLALYAGFVISVLSADIWHRTSWRPWNRRGQAASAPELHTGLMEAVADQLEAAPPAGVREYSRGNSGGSDHGSHVSVELSFTPRTERAQSFPLEASRSSSGPLPAASLPLELQAILPGRRSRLAHHSGTTYEERLHMSARSYRQRALAELAHSDSFFDRRGDRPPWEPEDEDQEPEGFEGYVPPVDLPALREDGGGSGEHEPDPEALLEKRDSGAEADTGSLLGRSGGTGHRAEVGLASGQLDGGEAASGKEAEGLVSQLCKHPTAARAYSATCSVAGALNCAFTWAEWPLTLLRRVSIPLIESEYYSRRWFLASLVGAPVWLVVYLGFGTTVLLQSVAIGALASVLAALATQRDPAAPPVWGFGTGVPIGAAVLAGAGFVTAALWIDTLASELVGMLNFFGLLLGIDHAVLGLTVLAWGNSIGDLSTDIAMARKGLSNMAMTACYGGPVFNMLMGLGMGFLLLLRSQGGGTVLVSASTAVITGMAFIAVYCLCILVTSVVCKQRLPAKFGWFLLTFYSLYIVANIVLISTSSE